MPGVDPDSPPESLLALGSERLAAALMRVLQDHPDVMAKVIRLAMAESAGQTE